MRGEAELRDERDDRFAPSIPNVGFDGGNSAIECAEQIGQGPFAAPSLMCMSQPSKAKGADPRAIRPREKFRCRAGSLGKIRANLGDTAGLHGRAAVGRLRIHAARMSNRRDPDALLEHTGEDRVRMAIEVKQAHHRIIADRR